MGANPPPPAPNRKHSQYLLYCFHLLSGRTNRRVVQLYRQVFYKTTSITVAWFLNGVIGQVPISLFFLCAFWHLASEKADGNGNIWKKRSSYLEKRFLCKLESVSVRSIPTSLMKRPKCSSVSSMKELPLNLAVISTGQVVRCHSDCLFCFHFVASAAVFWYAASTAIY